MATGNVLSIVNRSLLSIGSQSQVSNLNEGSTQANACSTLFTPTFQNLARAAHWNCLRQQTVLSLLAAAKGTPENVDGTTLPLPPYPWLYSYALPSDCLQARFLVPSAPSVSGGTPMGPAFIGAATYLPPGGIPFHVAYGTDVNNNPLQIILTNQTQAQLVYTVDQPNPQIWDSSFQSAMVASLAAYLVPALSLNITLMQIQIKVAETIIMQARVRDADEGSNSQDHIPDWMRARNVGSIDYGYGGYNGTWSDMSWGV